MHFSCCFWPEGEVMINYEHKTHIESLYVGFVFIIFFKQRAMGFLTSPVTPSQKKPNTWPLPIYLWHIDCSSNFSVNLCGGVKWWWQLLLVWGVVLSKTTAASLLYEDTSGDMLVLGGVFWRRALLILLCLCKLSRVRTHWRCEQIVFMSSGLVDELTLHDK